MANVRDERAVEALESRVVVGGLRVRSPLL